MTLIARPHVESNGERGLSVPLSSTSFPLASGTQPQPPHPCPQEHPEWPSTWETGPQGALHPVTAPGAGAQTQLPGHPDAGSNLGCASLERALRPLSLTKVVLRGTVKLR